MSLAENPDNSQIEIADPDTVEKNSEQSSEVALDVVKDLLESVSNSGQRARKASSVGPLTSSPAADRRLTRKQTGGLLTPRSKRLGFFTVKTPADILTRVRTFQAKMATLRQAQKRSRDDLRAESDDPNMSILSTVESKCQRPANLLNTSFLDPELVRNYPNLTLAELESLQNVEPEVQESELLENASVIGPRAQQHIYAEIQPQPRRPRSLPAHSHETSVVPVEMDHM
jgi:hypothetical protein